MRQVIAVVCVLLVVGVVTADKPARVAAPAIAPAVEPAPKNLNFQAEIVSFKDNQLTLKVEKEERTYKLAEKAECMNADSKPVTELEKTLTKGTKVEVWLNESGKEIKKLKIAK